MPDASPKQAGLNYGPLGRSAAHLCVDMQRLFAGDTPWTTPWMERVTPLVVALAQHRPDDIVFTRFIPLERPEDGAGTWRRYYERWASLTLQALDPGLLDLVPALARFSPPAPVIDKRVYSPWTDGRLHRLLQDAGKDTLVVTGAETEVCVAATVLGAVDHGYRVVVATDAVCSSADGPHDAMIDIYHSRFGLQVEAAQIDEIITAWS